MRRVLEGGDPEEEEVGADWVELEEGEEMGVEMMVQEAV